MVPLVADEAEEAEASVVAAVVEAALEVNLVTLSGEFEREEDEGAAGEDEEEEEAGTGCGVAVVG